MRMSILAGLAAFAVIGLTAPTFAQGDTSSPIHPAADGSVEQKTGSAILYSVSGRTREDALASGSDFNPYAIDGEFLLNSIGGFFVTVDYADEPVHEGELSIFPSFNTPLGEFTPSAATPAIIPFAIMQGGVCHGGYVAGYPVPDAVYSVDMKDQICHAAIVEEIVYAEYAAANPGQVAEPEKEPQPEQVPPETQQTTFDAAHPLDIDLDVAVWAAYNAAYNIAIADADYFFIRNGDFAPVRAAIIAELEKEGLPGINVIAQPLPDEKATYGCAPGGTTELRVAFTSGNAGITIVAASPQSVSTYRYFPEKSYDLDIDYAHECQTEGLGRPRTQGVH